MKKIKATLGKLKHNKTILIILITGVALLFMPTGEKEKQPIKDNYEKEFVKELEGILGEIDGVGRVSVMVSFYDKGSKVPITDKSKTEESSNEKTISVSGEVAVLKEEYPAVRGVVVVCSGGGGNKVREDVINAVSAITGAAMHNIEVFEMEG